MNNHNTMGENQPATKPLASNQRLNPRQRILLVLMVAIIGLLPFGRLSEVPIIIAIFWGLWLLFTDLSTLQKLAAFKPLTLAFLAYFALTLISSVDSYWQQKSVLIALASVRFYLLGLVVIYHANSLFLQQVFKWTVVLMVVWAIDALVQSFLGHNLLGQSSYPGRLTGVFGQNVKLGPVLAMMLPMVLLQMCHYQAWLRWFVVAMVLVVILLSGTRSAWLMMGFVLIIFWWQHVKGRRWFLLLKATALSLFAVVVLWFSSHDFQLRIDRSLGLLQGEAQAMDFALADRLPIWNAAINMYVEHPINGVGARAFRQVYTLYAEPGDVWVAKDGSALHAHHWVLELLAETGTVGLLLMLWMMVVVVRYARSDFNNHLVWPLGVGLMAAMLPLVSMYSLFSSFWSICLWWLLIMLFAGVKKGA